MFLLFAGNDYYPRGGAYDLQGRYETLEAAMQGHDPDKYEYGGGWANILWLGDMTIMKCFESSKWIEYAECMEAEQDSD